MVQVANHSSACSLIGLLAIVIIAQSWEDDN